MAQEVGQVRPGPAGEFQELLKVQGSGIDADLRPDVVMRDCRDDDQVVADREVPDRGSKPGYPGRRGSGGAENGRREAGPCESSRMRRVSSTRR
jgi:hypothetical protein